MELVKHHFTRCLCNKYTVSMLLLLLQRCLCRFALPKQSNASGIFCGFWNARWHGSQLSSLQFCRTFPDAIRLFLFEENMSKVTIATPQNTKISCGHLYRRINIIFTMMHVICFQYMYCINESLGKGQLKIWTWSTSKKQTESNESKIYFLHSTIYMIKIWSIMFFSIFMQMTTPPKTNEKGTLKTMDWKFKISLLF